MTPRSVSGTPKLTNAFKSWEDTHASFPVSIFDLILNILCPVPSMRRFESGKWNQRPTNFSRLYCRPTAGWSQKRLGGRETGTIGHRVLN
ncbi:hypothetical protein R1flu_024033 [Riccia fluitans]|uniref:Uncharacterized protein n=1 Tax=Riccia fluitans TaxID=41844 RepID=A0ABD1XWR7_9MARC